MKITKGKRLLISFIPPKKIVDNLSKIRKIAGITVKKGSGSKVPHVTIVDDSFSDILEVSKRLKEIVENTKKFVVRIKGINTFNVDQKLKIEKYKETPLIYLMGDNPRMSKFRMKIIRELSSLKTKDRLNQWKKENPKLSKKGLGNVRKYGTAFGPKEWKFHTTVGLIPKEKKKEILKKLDKLNIKENWEIDSFALYERQNSWKLIKKFKLK